MRGKEEKTKGEKKKEDHRVILLNQSLKYTIDIGTHIHYVIDMYTLRNVHLPLLTFRPIF